MLKLREMIKRIRACKTAEEERSIINKESAEIRNMSKDLNNPHKTRSITKCIYMNMMGFQTNFIQVATINQLASSNFTDKRIAYIALCALFDHKSEVLLLATQAIKKDLESQNDCIVAMALNAIGEICTPDMCRELAPEVVKLMGSPFLYIKKKAALACTKIIRKCPDMIELFTDKLDTYFQERSNGVLIAGLTLAVQIFKQDPNVTQEYKKNLHQLCKTLRNLIAISYAPEYDVNGITDPFLQCRIIEILRYFPITDEISETLVAVSTATETKSTGNSIQYEIAKTINQIEANPGLRALSNTILGKLLTNKDNNYKYIALNTLRETVKTDLPSVQKHKNVILDCLKDSDISIQRRALDLVYLIVSTNNIKHITKECLNFLLDSKEEEIKLELTTKMIQSLEKFAPNYKYQIDTIIKMLVVAGNYFSSETISKVINLFISVEELKIYTIHKLYLAVTNNMTQEGLVKVFLYVIGESGDVLVQNSIIGPNDEEVIVTEVDVLGTLNLIRTNLNNPNILEYLMNTLVKLLTKFTCIADITKILEQETKSFHYEVQERAVEYITFDQILDKEMKRSITKPIPVCKNEFTFVSQREVVGDETEEEEEDKNLQVKLKVKPRVNKEDISLIDNKATEVKPSTGINLIKDFENLFSTPGTNADVPTNLIEGTLIETSNHAVIQNNSGMPSNLNLFLTNDLIDLTIKTLEDSKSTVEAFKNSHITVTYNCIKNPDGSLNGTFYVSNNTGKVIENVKLNFMVLRFVNFKVLATIGTHLEPNEVNGIKKEFTLTSSEPDRKIVVKIRNSYTIEGQMIFETFTIDDLK